MAAFYQLQIVRYDRDRPPCVVVTFPPGRKAEQDLVAALAARVLAVIRPADSKVLAEIQAKGVGWWRSEAHVLAAVQTAMAAESASWSAALPAAVQTALAEYFYDAKAQVTP